MNCYKKIVRVLATLTSVCACALFTSKMTDRQPLMFCIVVDFSNTMKDVYKSMEDEEKENERHNMRNENKHYLKKVAEIIKNIVENDLSENDKVLAVGFGAKDKSVGHFDIIRSLQAATHFPSFFNKKQLENSGTFLHQMELRQRESKEKKQKEDLENFEHLVAQMRSFICTNSFASEGFTKICLSDLPKKYVKNLDDEIKLIDQKKRNSLVKLLNDRLDSISSSLMRSFDEYVHSKRYLFDPYFEPKHNSLYDRKSFTEKTANEGKEETIARLEMLNSNFYPQSDAHLHMINACNSILPLIHDTLEQKKIMKKIDDMFWRYSEENFSDTSKQNLFEDELFLWKYSANIVLNKNNENWVEYKLYKFLERKTEKIRDFFVTAEKEAKKWLINWLKTAETDFEILCQFENRQIWEILEETFCCRIKHSDGSSSDFWKKFEKMRSACVTSKLQDEFDQFFKAKRQDFSNALSSPPESQSEELWIDEFTTQTLDRLTDHLHAHSQSLQQCVAHVFEKHEDEILANLKTTSSEMEIVLDKSDKEEKWWKNWIKSRESFQKKQFKSNLTDAAELIRERIHKAHENEVFSRLNFIRNQLVQFDVFVENQRLDILLKVYKLYMEKTGWSSNLIEHQTLLVTKLEQAEQKISGSSLERTYNQRRSENYESIGRSSRFISESRSRPERTDIQRRSKIYESIRRECLFISESRSSPERTDIQRRSKIYESIRRECLLISERRSSPERFYDQHRYDNYESKIQNLSKTVEEFISETSKVADRLISEISEDQKTYDDEQVEELKQMNENADQIAAQVVESIIINGMRNFFTKKVIEKIDVLKSVRLKKAEEETVSICFNFYIDKTYIKIGSS